MLPIKFKVFLKRHSGTIFTVLTCAGSALTTYLSYSGGYKAHAVLDEQAKAKHDLIYTEWMNNEGRKYRHREDAVAAFKLSGINTELTPKEKIGFTWKQWGPAIGSCLMTIGFAVCSRNSYASVVGSLASMLNASNLRYETFTSNVQKEMSRERYERAINNTNHDLADKYGYSIPGGIDELAILGVKDDASCLYELRLFDDKPGLYFWSNAQKLDLARAHLNTASLIGKQIETDEAGDYIPLAMWKAELGLPFMDTEDYLFGFPVTKRNQGCVINYCTQMYTLSDGTPISRISFINGPYNYDDPKFHEL